LIIMSDSKQKADPDQVKMMEEQIILVDGSDKPLGQHSKEHCHRMTNIKAGVLHRAFSAFLFNSDGKLLLQQRSGVKITFPLRWTNTCCSHPLATAAEKDEKDNIGVKRAALRKLEHELGIKLGSIKEEEVHHLTRIHYLAQSDQSEWGEHEVDHILFIQKDVQLKPNRNEVAATQWVNADELKALFRDQEKRALFITPWFHLIAERFLYQWWTDLPKIIKQRGLGADFSAKIYKLGMEKEKEKENGNGATSNGA